MCAVPHELGYTRAMHETHLCDELCLEEAHAVEEVWRVAEVHLRPPRSGRIAGARGVHGGGTGCVRRVRAQRCAQEGWAEVEQDVWAG